MQDIKEKITSPCWIIGHGGHAKVVESIWHGIGGEIAGYIQKEPTDVRNVKCEEDFLRDLQAMPQSVLVGIGCVRASHYRLELLTRYEDHGAQFPIVVSPRAFVATTVKIHAGVTIMPGAVVASDVVIGKFSIVNHNAVVDHDAFLGPGVHVAPGAVVGGSVVLEAGVFIGAGSVIKQGVKIAAFATVGAGAVVLKDVSTGAVVVGCPAKAI